MPPASRVAATKGAFVEAMRRPCDAASLAVVRIALGLIIAIEGLRLLSSDKLLAWMVEPRMHFTFWGFSWVRPWPGESGPALHALALSLAALVFATGRAPKIVGPLLFLLTAQLFLIEQAYYLNHYYLLCLLTFWFIFLPHHGRFVLGRSSAHDFQIPSASVWLLRGQMFIVYFYAGLAKLNLDWLNGQPLQIWFGRRSDFPLLGPLLQDPSVAVIGAWVALVFDLGIGFLLLSRRTRVAGFCLAAAFHGFNHFVWDIGIFPWFALSATTLYFDPDWPLRVFRRAPAESTHQAVAFSRWLYLAMAVYFVWQVLFPFRHWLYPGNVSWTEEGHYYAWHMKLRNKQGTVQFVVVDLASGDRRTVSPATFLTTRQVRKMAGRPELILQAAHHLRDRARSDGRSVAVYAHTWVSLNGRAPQPIVVPTRDLSQIERSVWPKDWIVPLVNPLR